MLVQLTVKNFKSIKEESTFSLVASKYHKEHQSDNVINLEDRDYSSLKSAVLYGANASGKSVLLKAMGFIKSFIKKSSKESQAKENIAIEPFKLSTETEHEPSSFELIFLFNKIQYRYGFEVNSTKVLAEWLYVKRKREVEVFYRENQSYSVNESKYKIAQTLVDRKMIRDNALLLSVSAQFNEKISKDILEWLQGFNIISGIKDHAYKGFTIEAMQNDPKFKQRILSFIKFADLGIEDLSVEEFNTNVFPSDIPEDLKEFIVKNKESISPNVLTSHKKYDKRNILVDRESFIMDKDESAGTQKYFSLAGPIIDTLDNGGVLVIDELDARLHPILVFNIISLFHSNEVNKKNAQLIFATHDTNLLSQNVFRRDQIWLVEKDRYGASSFYSLADFKSTSEDDLEQNQKSIRSDENFEKNYLLGKYGAVPYIGNISSLISE